MFSANFAALSLRRRLCIAALTAIPRTADRVAKNKMIITDVTIGDWELGAEVSNIIREGVVVIGSES